LQHGKIEIEIEIETEIEIEIEELAPRAHTGEE
jgi:hypothetical protein